MIVLDDQQQNMYDTMFDWYLSSNRSPYIVCSGYAGTGKTTILGEVLKGFGKLNVSVSCATFTGKASHVLVKKIQDCPFNYCGTIHGLIYKPNIDPKTGELIGFTKNSYDDINTDLIIIDECSMIDKDIFNDLLYYNVPIIFIGDNAQLPPVSNKRFDIFENISSQLTKIHRQAEESMIIQLSMMVRNNEPIEQGHGDDCARLDWVEDKDARDCIYGHDPYSDEIILCGMNKTRQRLNRIVRKKQGRINPSPYTGEKIVCLQNNHNLGVMNGQIGFVDKLYPFSDYAYEMDMDFNGIKSRHCVYSQGFGKIKQDDYWKVSRSFGCRSDLEEHKYKKLDSFDYGYALSVHKSQGSQWDSVILINERNGYQSNEDYRKWLYTGITRAERKLIIIDDF